MQANCTNCPQRIVIDDAKVPDRAFSVKCPKCQTVVRFPGKGAAPVVSAAGTGSFASNLPAGAYPAAPAHFRLSPPTPPRPAGASAAPGSAPSPPRAGPASSPRPRTKYAGDDDGAAPARALHRRREAGGPGHGRAVRPHTGGCNRAAPGTARLSGRHRGQPRGGRAPARAGRLRPGGGHASATAASPARASTSASTGSARTAGAVSSSSLWATSSRPEKAPRPGPGAVMADLVVAVRDIPSADSVLLPALAERTRLYQASRDARKRFEATAKGGGGGGAARARSASGGSLPGARPRTRAGDRLSCSRSSSFQRGSGAPVMNQLEPLSATNMP